jgi:hypothetical protein
MAATSLTLTPDDFEGAVFTHEGRLRLDLTDGGLDRLAGAIQQYQLAKLDPAKRAEWLSNIPNAQLVELAVGRWGGPEEDVLQEAIRRIQVIGEKLRPAFAAARAAGLVEEPVEPAAAVVAEAPGCEA